MEEEGIDTGYRCFKVKVKTTNDLKDTFFHRLSGNYFVCREGEVFVIAHDLQEASAIVGDVALGVEEIGVGLIASAKSIQTEGVHLQIKKQIPISSMIHRRTRKRRIKESVENSESQLDEA